MVLINLTDKCYGKCSHCMNDCDENGEHMLEETSYPPYYALTEAIMDGLSLLRNGQQGVIIGNEYISISDIREEDLAQSNDRRKEIELEIGEIKKGKQKGKLQELEAKKQEEEDYILMMAKAVYNPITDGYFNALKKYNDIYFKHTEFMDEINEEIQKEFPNKNYFIDDNFKFEFSDNKEFKRKFAHTKGRINKIYYLYYLDRDHLRNLKSKREKNKYIKQQKAKFSNDMRVLTWEEHNNLQQKATNEFIDKYPEHIVEIFEHNFNIRHLKISDVPKNAQKKINIIIKENIQEHYLNKSSQIDFW